MKLLKCLLIVALICGVSTFALAQESMNVESEADEREKEAMKKDKTGTNPINFTNDFRVYYNFSQLNTVGDGESHTATVEYRTPFADGDWQFRIRAPQVFKEADLTGNGVNDIDDSGLGDFNVRFLTVPIMNMEKKFALATGLEVYFDTANDPKLGSSSIYLGPQVFAVFFKPPGGGTLIAPAYQHVFSVGGKNVNRTQLDVFYLYTFPKKFINWALINPQGIIDYENDDRDSWNVDIEVGKMLTKNQSVYLRPGFGIGTDRLFDFDVEVGWKVVW
jgi:hypothetical protein